MQIYNTFSRKKEKIDLKKKIGIYVCGVTPYDTTHLGHAFTFVIYDALIRYLRFLGASVTYVQNVTDIDDDILIKSKSLKVTWKELGETETKKHLQNMDGLNVLRPDYYPHASQNIDEMIKITSNLISKKFAYVKNGSVYFAVKNYKNFGNLSRYGYPAMLEIANDRGNFPLDPNKQDPLDFVLWQAQKPDEPYWDSPWGKGRPGWHIECSAMSMKYLGPTLTIHGGGEDLIFPHHECEIAQSENYTNRKFVETWMHVAMVYCCQHKMSKSLGNMIFVNDLLKRYSSNTIRVLLLSHHYRKSWNYEEAEFEKAKKTAELFEKFLLKNSKVNTKKAQDALPGFFNALENDLDTPSAIEALIGYINSKTPNPTTIKVCCEILGLV